MFSILSYYTSISAQSTVQLDTIHKDNKVSVSLTINSNFSDSSQIEVQYFHIIDSDSIMVFEGIYDFMLQDPSGFSQFELNDEKTQMILNIGWFDPYTSFATILISRGGQVTEQFMLN